MIRLTKHITHFMDVFRANKHQIYLVGGAVRDLLLGLEITNWDFTTNAKPDEIQKLFPDSFYHNTFGTVTVPYRTPDVVEPHLFEITPFRHESDYTDMRHPETIEWADTIEEDLKRRDFTINAMAFDGTTIVDPYKGQEHLAQKLIVAVNDPDKRFQEDALRLMRGIRFASELGFLIEDATRDSIKKNSSLIQHVSWERIRDEFLKILASDHPAEGVLFLRNSNILSYILPEVNICFSVPQKSPKRHHVYDVGTHLVMALKYCPSSDPITRFATLIHDIGKAQTYRKDETTQIITFYNHEVVGEQQTRQIAQRFRLSNKQSEKLIVLVAKHQFTVSELQTDKAVRRFIREVGLEYVQDMLDLRSGDRIGSGAKPTSWRYELFKKRLVEVQHEPFKVTDLKVNGKDVMDILQIKPGPKVGEILNALFSKVEEEGIKNERSILISEIEKMK